MPRSASPNSSQAPLSRSESQRETRRQLLDAARRLFAERGYTATSLEAIAREAGFSKGAIYSNFDNKEQVFLAVMRERKNQGQAQLLAILEERPAPQVMVQQIGAWADQQAQRGMWTYLVLEYARHVADRPELQAMQFKIIRSSWRFLGQRLYENYFHPDAPFDGERLGALIMSLTHAAVASFATTPTVGELIKTTLTGLLEAYGRAPAPRAPGRPK